MPVRVVYQWSIRPEDSAACEDGLARIVEHIRADHGDVLGAQLYRQWAGPLPRRAYVWMEEHASLTAIEGSRETPACAEVWGPLEAIAQPGTWTTSVWFEGDERLQLLREP